MNKIEWIIKLLKDYEKKAEETNDTEMRFYYLGKIDGIRTLFPMVTSAYKGEDTNE